MPEFKGTDKGMYCPEWAHAVAGDHGDRAAVYHGLYAAAAETWVADGRLNHAVTALGNEQDTLDAWFWLGFGLVVVDAVRDLSPIMTPTAGRFATYRLATATDIPELFPLYCEHQLYYQHSPMFEPKVPLRDANELAELMADPRKQLWLAAGPDGGILGFVEGTANSTDACTIVRDPSTLACTGAYLTPRLRGQGIGAGLLGEMVQWAADHGFVRLSLDFESANGPGRRFWLSHCSPACYSVLRHVNNRVLGHRPLA